MPKKCPDKQQNQEEPPLLLSRDMPHPARRGVCTSGG
jgi:hypothetical protein